MEISKMSSKKNLWKFNNKYQVKKKKNFFNN